MTAVLLELFGDYSFHGRRESVEVEDEGREAEVFHGFTHHLSGFEDLVAHVRAEEQQESLVVGYGHCYVR